MNVRTFERSEPRTSERPNVRTPTDPNDPTQSSPASVRNAFSEAGALARALDGYEPRDGQRRMAEAVADVIEERRDAAGRSGHRHRQDARVSDPRDPEPPARARLHRHQEPPGTDLLQGPAGAQNGARRAVHRDADEGTRELPVPAPMGDVSRRRGREHVGGRAGSIESGDRVLLPIIEEWLAADRRPAIAPSCATCRRTCRCGRRSPPRPTRAWAPSVRATAIASSR